LSPILDLKPPDSQFTKSTPTSSLALTPSVAFAAAFAPTPVLKTLRS
ncbi:2761_t:CDS:1, partial [Rhizophagus irregularis]